MIIVSEQQTYAKLRFAPLDFAQLCDTDPKKAMEYIIQLQGDREKVVSRAKKPQTPKDPNAPKSKRGRQGPEIDLDQL